MTSNELERNYLLDRIEGTPTKSLSGLWRQFLDQEEVSSGALQERQKEYLGDIGYIGVFAERWVDFKNDLPIELPEEPEE